ncbi:MAG: TolC family protein [Nitrospirota bacterium]
MHTVRTEPATSRKRGGLVALCCVLLSLALPAGPAGGETAAIATIATIEGRTLTLDECIAIGLKSNPAAEISFQNLRAVEERIGEAWGTYYPSLKLTTAYTYTTPQDDRMAILPDSYDTRFFLRQLLFDAGGTSSLVRSIRHSIRTQEYDLQRTNLDIVVNVTTSYHEVLKRHDLIEVAQAAFTSADTHLQQARELYKEGLAPRSDVIKAEVQRSNAQLDIIRAENSHLLAKANLAAAMGLPVTTGFAVVPVPGKVTEPAALPPLGAAMAAAYDQRPELKGSRARIDAAEAGVQQARSGFYPNLSLDASYGWQESSFLPDDKKWSVGVTASIPLFEQLTARSRVNQARASLAGTRAAETQTKRAVELDVEQAWLALKEALERSSVTERTLEQAREDMRVSEGRYREGVGNILEVNDAQTALTQARTNHVVALYDIVNAQARLDRAIGKGPVARSVTARSVTGIPVREESR